ncbi:MAG: galactokinase [Brooklawnia sp.]|uniref:galactokinase n=1 Tax=Brooklawnia sp. TaxID=2699740 RepID=UPI003C731A37
MSEVDPRTLVAEFGALYGSAPQGVWSAPGRLNLIGEHVDYNDGLVLPIALPRRAWVALRARDDGRIRLASRQLPERYDLTLAQVQPGVPSGWGAYAAGVLAILARAGYPVTGADLLVSSEVPVGAGLSSSAALEAAVGAAASEALGLGLLADDASRSELAELCRRAENEIAGAPTGGMDQAAALRSRAGHALLLDCRDGSVRHIPFDPAGHGLELLVIDTRARHELVDGQYGERRASCEQAARLLGVPALRDVPIDSLDEALSQLPDERLRSRAEHVVTEIDRVRQAVEALADDDFVRLGSLFTASHASLRDRFEVSSPELDAAVEVALAGGALGARMTGGGFGGSAIALIPAGLGESIGWATRTRFAAQNWAGPQVFSVTAAGPAQ